MIAIFACLKLCAKRIKGLKFFLVLLGSKLSAMKLTCDIHTAQKFHNIYKKFSWFFAGNVDINVEINISKEICFIKVVWSKFAFFLSSVNLTVFDIQIWKNFYLLVINCEISRRKKYQDLTFFNHAT